MPHAAATGNTVGVHNPVLLLVLLAAGIYVATLWREDLRAAEAGQPVRGALPGATPAPRHAIVAAVAGAFVLLALETAGEFALGLAEQQSRMTWLFAAYSIVSAPVIEELIFRGWIVVENRGRGAVWSGAVAASVVFALLHPFLWEWDEEGFRLTLNAKGVFSTAMLFAGSVWFYAARLAPWNPSRSLLPCFAAHAAKNAGVVAIKAACGYMDGIW